jgi:hypothetical protein
LRGHDVETNEKLRQVADVAADVDGRGLIGDAERGKQILEGLVALP